MSSPAIQPISGAIVQAKLEVGAPNDRFEQEADRVADDVMRMPETRVAQTAPATAQRVCSKCAAEDVQREPAPPWTLQRQCAACAAHQERTDERDGDVVRTKPERAARTPAVSPAVESNIARLRRGGGLRLPESTRSFVEPRFGHDFSNVRVHAGAQAAEASRQLHARAFTVGTDIFFAKDAYQPHTQVGTRLLAHELTHTIQQSRGRVGSARTQAQSQEPAPLQRAPEEAPEEAPEQAPEEVPGTSTTAPPVTAGVKCKDILDPATGQRGRLVDVVSWLSDTVLAQMRESAFEVRGGAGGRVTNDVLLAKGVTLPKQIEHLNRILIVFSCEVLGRGNPFPKGAPTTFTNTTKRLVKAVQRWARPSIGLDVDGIVGPFTIEALDAFILGETPTPLPVDQPGTLDFVDLGGGLWEAAKPGASLTALAKQVGTGTQDWRCIEPLSMAMAPGGPLFDPANHFESGENWVHLVSPGDRFDASCLLPVPPESNHAMLMTADTRRQAEWITSMFFRNTGFKWISADEIDSELGQASRVGANPISALTLFGHTAGGLMFDSSPIFGAATGSQFDPMDALRADAPAGEWTFRNATMGIKPRRCWFDRQATVFAIGCSSQEFGQSFARAYLRPPATIFSTTRTLMSFCWPSNVGPEDPRRAPCAEQGPFNAAVFVPEGLDDNARRAHRIRLMNTPERPGDGPYADFNDLVANAGSVLVGIPGLNIQALP